MRKWFFKINILVTVKARAAVANPIVCNVTAFRTGNKRIGTFLFCAITTMCFIKRGGSTLASNKIQHTLSFSKARVTTLMPKITDFLKFMHKLVQSNQAATRVAILSQHLQQIVVKFASFSL